MHVINEKNCSTAQKHISTSSSQCFSNQIIMKRGHDPNCIHCHLWQLDVPVLRCRALIVKD